MSIDMDGLALLEAVIAGERPGPEMWAVMELSLISAAVGTVTIAGRPSILHLNGIGTVHGGYVATILDSAMACAIQSTLPAGGRYTTAEMKISCLRPVSAGGEAIMATGEVLNTGRRLAFAQASLRDQSGRLLAHGTTTCAIL